MVQEANFAIEIEKIKHHKQLTKTSKLLTLNPFLNENSILRVGGRLHNANVKQNHKHPVLIPHNGHITILLIHKAHLETNHGGIQTTMARLRQEYWIIGAQNSIKKIIHNCVKCTIINAKPLNQLMGNLPMPRVNITRPFAHTGVDYAGPISIRTAKGRGHKTFKQKLFI